MTLSVTAVAYKLLLRVTDFFFFLFFICHSVNFLLLVSKRPPSNLTENFLLPLDVESRQMRAVRHCKELLKVLALLNFLIYQFKNDSLSFHA